MSTSDKSLAVAPEQTGGPSPLSQRVRSLRLPDEAINGAPAGSRFAWMLCVLLGATTVMFGYLAFSRPKATNVAADAASTSAQPPWQATPGDASGGAAGGDIALEAKGYIVPAHQILVSPKVSGMIERLHVKEGDRVEKGKILAELEKTDYQADRDRAAAFLEQAKQRLRELESGNRPEEIKQARAELAEAEAQLPQLEGDWRRANQLVKTNVLSQQEFDLAESRYQAMKRRVERLRAALRLMEEGARDERRLMARAEVQQAEAELAKAQWRLDNCTIRAPIAGTILKKNAEEGNIVNPIAFNGSFSICDMADLSDLEIELTIQERDISRVFLGQQCKIRTEAYPEREYQGVVSRLMPIADRAKGAIPVRVKVSVPAAEEGVYLKPEMGATVSFRVGSA